MRGKRGEWGVLCSSGGVGVVEWEGWVLWVREFGGEREVARTQVESR